RPRPGSADARAGPRARLPDIPRLHGGAVARDRGVGRRGAAGRLGGPRRRLPWRRWSTGRTSTAASSSPTTPFRAWSSGWTSAGGSPIGPVLGWSSATTRGPDPGPRPDHRAPGPPTWLVPTKLVT